MEAPRWTLSLAVPRYGEITIARSACCRNSCRYRILGRSLQACRSRPRFFGSIQCSMGFEMIRGSKNSWARTRTSEPATPDSEPSITWDKVKTLCSSKSFGRSLIAALISLVKIFLQQGTAESIRARKSQVSCVLVDIGRHCVTQNFLEIPL
jgi:hypothetical protein